MLSVDNLVFNANNYQVPKHFLNKIFQLALEQSTNKHIDWTTITNCLQTIIAEEWSDLPTLGNKIIKILDSDTGFVVVKNLPFQNYQRPILDYMFASLSLCLGSLTVHNSSNNPIWDVTPRSHTGGREPTFSELNDEAPLHTDSAFRILPEKYFALWTIQAARDGGNSTAIKVEKLIDFCQQSTSGRRCIDILYSRKFPFCVPPAFANQNQSEIIQAPILADSPLIRFRIDTLMKGFKHHPELATPERLWAVKYFERAIRNYPNKLEFKLNDGDVVFFNNHTMLHGRTAFSDRKRLLLRIRIHQD